MMNTLTKTKYEESTNEELAVLAREDSDALEKLVSQNEGFVIFMTKNFLGRNGNDDKNDLDDYSQICRMAIVKAVKNFEPDVGVRFITYAGRIMRNDMLRQMEKDNVFRENNIEAYIEEKDTTAEDSHEDYGDSYDNRFENQCSYDVNVLPSFFINIINSKDPAAIEQNEVDAKSTSNRLGLYSAFVQKVYEEKEQEKPDCPDEKSEKKVLYLTNKETEHSWKYPIFFKALHNLQLETVLQELLNDRFDSAQREYLIYRFGLKDLTPKTIKETADHFNLTVSYAKKIEKKGLEELKGSLIMNKLL